MYSNLAQQANIYADNNRNEVVSTNIGVNEYTCPNENNIYTPTYDANGNITEYVSDNGNIVAQYKYSAFGEIIYRFLLNLMVVKRCIYGGKKGKEICLK